VTSEQVTLTLPSEEEFQRVAHLVLGGLAARLDVTVESLEDLELALDELLEVCADGRDVTVSVTIDGGDVLRTAVGPFPAGALDDLSRDDAALGLRRVLETVCDSFEVEERDDGEWVELVKRVDKARTA
jgi:anti-sigma regulatory factor (Ser/Thr protein kinase)